MRAKLADACCLLLAGRHWEAKREQFTGDDHVDPAEDNEPTHGGCVAQFRRNWRWRGYRVWEEKPSTLSLMVRDWNFWAAVFFEVACCWYLWQALIPYVFDEYCMCEDERLACGGSGAGYGHGDGYSAGNSTVNASWGDATWSASWAESGNASWNGSEAGSGDGEVAMPELLPATGYCIMSWLGAFTFTYSPGVDQKSIAKSNCVRTGGGGRSQNARRRPQLQIRVSGPI